MLDFDPKNYTVILIEESVAVDPVSLSIYEKKAKKSHPESPVCFVRKEHTPLGLAYYYLKFDDRKTSERYLFSPLQFKHFQKRKACNELWHGCKIPVFEEIKLHAKILKHQELKR